ncbi:MAG: Rad52/Rad22 family DNA repair protein [Nitrospirota bacterium]
MTKTLKTNSKVNIKDINFLLPELGKGPEGNSPEAGPSSQGSRGTGDQAEGITQGEGQEVPVKPSLLETAKSFACRAFEELKGVLYRKFSPEQIKQRKGKGGRSFDYLETASVIDRLNEAFKFKWKLAVTEMTATDAEIDCLITLTAFIDGEWVSKEQYGSQERDRKKDGSGYVNTLGDDKKAAVSDGLKKCATLFGIGHFLYKK